MILKIVDIHNPILRKKAKSVTKIDKEIISLISDMKDTLAAQVNPDGVGLAAPQVGKSLAIFLMHYPDEGIKMKTIINPKIISMGKKKERKTKDNNSILEGCLSIPHYYGPVKRAQSVTLEYLDEHGNKKKEKFTGFPAHIVQHEVEHLKGILFIDHIFKNSSPLYKIKGDTYEKI